jgi:hypothetical protein
MNFVLFELAQDLRMALEALANDANSWDPVPDETIHAAYAAIAKAEAAGVTARVSATTTEGD